MFYQDNAIFPSYKMITLYNNAVTHPFFSQKLVKKKEVGCGRGDNFVRNFSSLTSCNGLRDGFVLTFLLLLETVVVLVSRVTKEIV